MVSFSFLSLDITTIVFIVLLVLLIVALLVVPMFTNKKRAKQTEELHRSLQPGDLIKTVGGIIGTIKEIRQVSPVDKEMVIETGEEGSKTTMVFDIQALYQVMSRATTVVPAEDEPAEETAAPEQEPAEQPAEPVMTEQTPEPADEAMTAEPAAEEQAAEEQPEELVAEEQPAEEQAAAEEAPAEKPAAPTKKKSGGAKKSK